jgi:phosphate transport system substrate-binding protein
MRKFLNQGFLAAATLAFGVSTATAIDITGAGATFPYPIYAKWAEAYKQKTNIGMNYQSIGSGGGIAQIKAKTVDFGRPTCRSSRKTSRRPASCNSRDHRGCRPVVNIEGVRAGAISSPGPCSPTSTSARSRNGTRSRSPISIRRSSCPTS